MHDYVVFVDAVIVARYSEFERAIDHFKDLEKSGQYPGIECDPTEPVEATDDRDATEAPSSAVSPTEGILASPTG